MKPHFTLILFLFPFITFSQGNPHYPAKPIDKRGPTYCYPSSDRDYFAVGYGFNQKQIAFKAYVTTFHYFTQLSAELDYRTPHSGHRYFDLQITGLTAKLSFLDELRIAAGYKRIKQNHQHVSEQYWIGPRLDRNRTRGISIAYAQQHQQSEAKPQHTSHGIMLALYKNFADDLIINTSTTYWFDQWQYSIRLRQRLRHIYLGFAYERVNEWWEVGMEVGVRM